LCSCLSLSIRRKPPNSHVSGYNVSLIRLGEARHYPIPRNPLHLSDFDSKLSPLHRCR
jgi:hypothetical protein